MQFLSKVIFHVISQHSVMPQCRHWARWTIDFVYVSTYDHRSMDNEQQFAGILLCEEKSEAAI